MSNQEEATLPESIVSIAYQRERATSRNGRGMSVHLECDPKILPRHPDITQERIDAMLDSYRVDMERKTLEQGLTFQGITVEDKTFRVDCGTFFGQRLIVTFDPRIGTFGFAMLDIQGALSKL